MREFTKTEIEICEEIAEKEKRKKESGDYVKIGNRVRLVTSGAYEGYYFTGDGQWQQGRGTLIWQEHDCLEFLKEKGWRNYQFSFTESGEIELHIAHVPFRFRVEDEIVVGGKFLEALLKAVLEVLNES